MNLQKKLSALVSEIMREAKANPQFAERLEQALGVSEPTPKQPKPRANRRPPAVIDPFQEFKQGEAVLRSTLSSLSLDQLRDVLAQYGMDRAKLAMKWKDQKRVIDLIVTTVATRLRQGDVFLAPTPEDLSGRPGSRTPSPSHIGMKVKSLTQAYHEQDAHGKAFMDRGGAMKIQFVLNDQGGWRGLFDCYAAEWRQSTVEQKLAMIETLKTLFGTNLAGLVWLFVTDRIEREQHYQIEDVPAAIYEYAKTNREAEEYLMRCKHPAFRKTAALLAGPRRRDPVNKMLLGIPATFKQDDSHLLLLD